MWFGVVLGGICGIIRIEVVESHKMAEAEEVQIKITVATCELNEAELRELCTKMEIVIPPEQKGRWSMIQLFKGEL